MDVNIGMAQKLTSPNPFALVSTVRPDGGANLMALSWWTYASNRPPMVTVCLSKKGWSGELIQETGKFGLNIVDESLAEAAFSCGTCSGRKVDKPTVFGIEMQMGETLQVPVVKASKVSMECRLVSVTEASDHNLYLGEVVATYFDPECRQLYAWDGYAGLSALKDKGE